MADSLMQLKRAIIEQDAKGAVEFTKAAIDAGAEEGEVVDAIAAALKEVGDLFECGELFLPEVMRAANASKAALNLVLNAGIGTGMAEGKGVVALGSLGPHDIGKTILTAKLTAGGFRLIDMGISLSPEKAGKILKENKVDILALSILLTSDIEKAAEIIRVARKIVPVKVMVGGAAMNEGTSKRIGSDAYGKDASEALAIARSFMGKGGQ